MLYIIATVVFAVSLTACGKYEDGPEVSLRSRKSRVDGDWKVTRYMVNGDDQTGSHNNDRYNFTKDGDVTYTYTDNGLSISSSGTWDLVNDDEQLRTTTTVFGFTNTDNWTILELRNETMKLRKTEGNSTEEVTLEQ